ncbi:MAG: hypothetical protein A2664_04090 [Candidatus Taylorbacteria bacterium RIFCSPHIGHO2_01_FULL_46_22b]|uniref:UDP-N-acetyl-alpha-D-muramoyl-L-alanyl-L-glutamate epimerase n=1 Tax=Candidatus Taylorbacteria bacterium RIFCSPHIGHO2_01_FULL_46_22b TaxID=1802301 RepID=A0A1G2M3W9_9BACT|nr:MAG: hypothetical protein A2664_04090 [Candidatus Taylorbacteria bacterium RIFCSPHIGHO2_01_FULL_46_22b]
MHNTDKFLFKGWEITGERDAVKFHYVLSHGKEEFVFAETLTLPKPLSVEDKTHANSILDFLLLALGVSYWKTFCPKIIETPIISLSEKQTVFWNTVYTKGLGEFFYKNKIDFRGLVEFPISSKLTPPVQTTLPDSDRSLVLLGGGKDSFVSGELVRKSGKQFSFFSLGDFPLIKEAAKSTGVELITIGRQIDPKLLELNKRSDVYNGHVPVSTLYSATAMLVALLYGFDEVVLSAEDSADYGNVEYLGEMINHQWSKSEEAEKLLRTYFSEFVSSDITFHSLIRNFSELQVGALFSKYPQYFDVFSSCNKNFLLTKRAERKWCGECPKCAFVFAILAPFIPKEKLVSIFGKNLFADEKLLPIYRELLGLEAFKPFECVGTPEETKLAFLLAHQKGEYEADIVMKQFVSLCSKEFDSIEKYQAKLLPHYDA